MKTKAVLSVIALFSIPALLMAQEVKPVPDAAKSVDKEEVETELEWKILAKPSDTDLKNDAAEFIKAIVDADDITDGVRAEEVEVMKKLQALLKLKPEKLTTKDLLGLKMVRSIQVSENGVFSYPYFKCQFKNKGKQTFFEKTAGSQRKSGLLFPDTAESLVLLGSWTVNNDPQHEYTGITKAKLQKHDETGVFIKRGKTILAIFPEKGKRYEVYEFK